MVFVICFDILQLWLFVENIKHWSRKILYVTPTWIWNKSYTKILCSVTLSIAIPLKYRGGEISIIKLKPLVEKVMFLVFSWIQVYLHLFAKCDILSKTFFTISAVSAEVLPAASVICKEKDFAFNFPILKSTKQDLICFPAKGGWRFFRAVYCSAVIALLWQYVHSRTDTNMYKPILVFTKTAK